MIRATYYSSAEDLDLLHWLATRSRCETTLLDARELCRAFGVVAEVRSDGTLVGYIGPAGHYWPCASVSGE